MVQGAGNWILHSRRVQRCDYERGRGEGGGQWFKHAHYTVQALKRGAEAAAVKRVRQIEEDLRQRQDLLRGFESEYRAV